MYRVESSAAITVLFSGSNWFRVLIPSSPVFHKIQIFQQIRAISNCDSDILIESTRLVVLLVRHLIHCFQIWFWCKMIFLTTLWLAKNWIAQVFILSLIRKLGEQVGCTKGQTRAEAWSSSRKMYRRFQQARWVQGAHEIAEPEMS